MLLYSLRMDEVRLSTVGQSLYRTLGVPRSATREEIRRAYRQRALENHPDKNPGDATAAGRFQEINRAHAVLTDPRKRQVYDRHGTRGLHFWEELERKEVNKFVLDFLSSGWCKCLTLLCALLTCCYCCCCCCCCCNFCCGRYKPFTTCEPGDSPQQPHVVFTVITSAPSPSASSVRREYHPDRRTSV